MVLLALLLLAQPTAVRATRMFDARRGAIVQPGLVVVDGERIVQVGGAAPAGARTIDLGDATLLPGLMDAHTHLSFESGASWYRDALELVLRWPAEQAQYAAEYARRTVESGFTTVRDLGSADFIDVGLKKAIDAGAVPGPRMIAAVHAVGSRGGHADLDPYPPDRVPPLGIREGICDGAEACRSAVRWQVKYGAGVIKLVASGGILSLADPVDNVQLSQAELDAIVEKALAAAKSWPEMIGNARRIGVRVAFGSDAGVGEHGKTNPQQLAWMVRWGFTPAAALQSATVVDAELLGVDAGVLE